MYKKITHNIVEEHFDHPIAGQIKKSMDRSKLVTNEILSESKFRSDMNSYFITYLADLTSMINSVAGNEEDLARPFEKMFQNCWIDGIGNETKPLYSSEFGQRINECFRSIAITTLLLVQLVKYGKDTTVTQGRFSSISNEIARTLNDFNNAWGYPTASSVFSIMGAEIVNQIKAKAKKDTSAELAASQKIAEQLFAFERVFVDGIVRQHSDRFSKATSAQNSDSNRDIM